MEQITPFQLALAIKRAIQLYDNSWNEGRHRLNYIEAAQQAGMENSFHPYWIPIISHMIMLAWNDTQIWADEVLRNSPLRIREEPPCVQSSP